VTVGAVVLGVVVGVLACAANLYMGLRAGITFAASVPAAALGVAVLRRTLPANIAQTAASAGESLAVGVFFCVPALLLAGVWVDFDYLTTTLLAFAGGMLGVFLMIPLREGLMSARHIEYVRGKMCADVLRSDVRVVKPVVSGFAVGAVSKIFSALSEGGVAAVRWGGVWGLDFAVAPFAAGAVFGPVVGLGVICGALLCAGVFVPLYGALYGVDTAASWLAVRYAGVGAMAAVAVFWLLGVWRDLVASLRSARAYFIHQRGSGVDFSSRAIFVVVVAIAAALLVHFCGFFGGSGEAFWVVAIVMGAILFVVAMASRFAGLGRPSAMLGVATFSVNPVTGAVLLVLSAVCVVMAGLMGGGFRMQELVLLGGGVLTTAAATAADISQDLKTGQIVGAKPFAQQGVQILGVLAAAPVVAFVLSWLHRGYGVGSDALPAPQATMFATITGALLGRKTPLSGSVFLLGVAVGGALVVLEWLLRRRWRGVKVPAMAVAVGLYLPPALGLMVGLGGVAMWLSRRLAGGRGSLLPVMCAGGLIGGEALTGVVCGLLRAHDISLALGYGALPSAIFVVLAFFLFVRFQRG